MDWNGGEVAPSRISVRGRRTLASSGSGGEDEQAEEVGCRKERLGEDSSQGEGLHRYRKQEGQPDEDGEVGEQQSVDGCLLYTSPSPRDGLLSRMPSSA